MTERVETKPDAADAGRTGPCPVIRDPMVLPDRLRKAVAVIGNFDGVHKGHMAVVDRAKALAARRGSACVAVTFEPHPSDFFARRSVVFRLTPGEAKAIALSRLGLDAIVVLSFDAVLAEASADAFVADLLVKRLDIGAAVVGYDFHFGRNREGSPSFLREAGERRAFEVDVVGEIKADTMGSLEAVHSTSARLALENGDVRNAAELLGHDWFVVGEVVHGEKRGRELGFPTANMVLDPSCRLRHGIYAVRVLIKGVSHGGVASYGRRPMFDNGPPLLEIFVFDFSGSLYGRTIEVAFVAWIRGEEKFDTVEALIARMRRDAEEARALLDDKG